MGMVMVKTTTNTIKWDKSIIYDKFMDRDDYDEYYQYKKTEEDALVPEISDGGWN